MTSWIILDMLAALFQNCSHSEHNCVPSGMLGTLSRTGGVSAMRILSSLSVVIPVYLQNQRDLKFLERCLDSIRSQTLFPSEIIITDDSERFFDEELKELISNYHELKVTLSRNDGKHGISQNSNNGMRLAKSKFVQVLHQDDWLVDTNFYRDLEQSLNISANTYFLLPWKRLNFYSVPQFDLTALFGNNRVGGPSGVIFPNDSSLSFDEELSMLCDVDFVYRLLIKFGSPRIFHRYVIEYGVSEGQAQNQISSSEFLNEIRRLFTKHKLSAGKILFLALTRYPPEVTYGIAKNIQSLGVPPLARVYVWAVVLYCRLLIRWRKRITEK